jgi:hypothetical protein
LEVTTLYISPSKTDFNPHHTHNHLQYPSKPLIMPSLVKAVIFLLVPCVLTAPAPSPAAAQASSKRGLVYQDSSLCSAFTSGKYGFAYNYAQTGSNCAGANFAPMLRSTSGTSAATWLSNVDKAYKAGSRVFLGFNEPDIAGIAPTQACSDWLTYMNPIAKTYSGVTIVGPAVSNSASPRGLAWLSSFKSACPSATWNASGVHYYDSYDSGTVQRFEDFVGQAYSQLGKPVWVTEFAPVGASAQQAAEFLKNVLVFMDGSSKVGGYAYFMVGTDGNDLNSGTGLSLTGQVYNS